jgi:hypothetical protein
MTAQFTKTENNAIELIKGGASFNGKIYMTRKGPQVYVKNMSFSIQRENVEFFETLKKNYSLGFAVHMNNGAEVRRAERLGYDAIEG